VPQPAVRQCLSGIHSRHSDDRRSGRPDAVRVGNDSELVDSDPRVLLFGRTTRATTKASNGAQGFDAAISDPQRGRGNA